MFTELTKKFAKGCQEPITKEINYKGYVITVGFYANGDVTVEVKGFYYGEPNEESTKLFYGCNKASFELEEE